MKCSLFLLLGVALAHPAAAVRSSDIVFPAGSPCTRAIPDPDHRWRFTLNHSQSHGVKHHDKYVLREQPDCGGPDLAVSVSVIPQIDPEDPLQDSSVVITVEPDDTHHHLYVCRKVANQDMCLTEVVLQRRAFRPRQVLMSLPLLKTSRRLLAVHLGESHPGLDALEWAICLLTLCLVATVFYALYIFFSAGRANDGQDMPSYDQQAHDESGEHAQAVCPIDISSPLWESLDAWLLSLSFVVACVALVGGLMSILVSSNGPVWLIFFTVTWPATLGNLLLYYFWMSTCRLQLFSAALSRGICIRGKHPMSPRLILAGGCLSVLLLSAVATIFRSLFGDSEAKDSVNMGKQIGPFVINPTASLVSVLVYLFCRNLAYHRTECPVSIEAMAQLMGQISTEEGEQGSDAHLPKDTAAGIWLARSLRSGSVPVVSEGSFYQLCREGRDPVEAIRSKEPLPVGRQFAFGDLAWQGRVVHQLSGYRTAIFNPPLALFFFLVLSGASWCFAIMSMATKPSIVGLEVSEYSLGQLYPPLRPWQTDYELVLDSFAHSFTFLETLSPDGAHKINMGLPGGRRISTSQRSEMVTVVSGRTKFPLRVNMEVMGILGRKTNYNLFIVTDFHLFPGVKIVPCQNGTRMHPRTVFAGEVDGSVLSVPEKTTEIEITFYQETYSMAVPVSKDEASENNASTLTVFSPEENPSIEHCTHVCRNEARCMTSRHNDHGCFFIWGPATLPPSAFNFSAEPVTEQSQCNHLGVRLCAREDRRAERICMDMELGVGGIRRQRLSFKNGIKLAVHVSTYSECKGLRKIVRKNLAELSFTRNFILPAHVLARVPGVDSTVKVDTRQEEDLTKTAAVTLTLHRYTPAAPKLTLHFAVLMADHGASIKIEGSAEKVCHLSNEQEAHNTSFWKTTCTRQWKAGQYSICGGWRPSRIVSCRLKAWAPSIDVQLLLAPPCSISVCPLYRTSLLVQTRTDNNTQPAEWSLADNNCSLDFKALEGVFADELLTPSLFRVATGICPSMRVVTGNRTRHWKIIEYVQQALRRGPSTMEMISLLDGVAKSPFIANKTAALQALGFHKCPHHTDSVCVQRGGTLIAPVSFSHIWPHLSSPSGSGLVKHALDLFSDREIEDRLGFSGLLYATEVKNEELVATLASYIKERTHFIRLAGENVNPALTAIKGRQANILGHILNVTTCCFKVWDRVQNQTLWEFAVASGCDECLLKLMERCGGGSRRSLFFSMPTRSDTWADLADVATAFSKLPALTSVGFGVLTQEAFLRTLVKLSWLSQQGGALSGLEVLFFTLMDPMKLHVDADSARLLCDVIRAQPRLRRLSLVGDADTSASDTLLGCLRETGLSAQSLELLDLVQLMPASSPPRFASPLPSSFRPPRCTPEENTTEVVSNIFVDTKTM